MRKKAAAAAPAAPIRDLTAVEAEIRTAAADLSAAEAELWRLRDARPNLLRDTSEEGEQRIEDHDATTARITRRVERLTAGLALLRAEQAGFVREVDQARRRGVYAAGEAAMAEYRRIAVEDYDAAARALAAVLAALRVQEEIVWQSNADRPDGSLPLDLGPTMYGVGTLVRKFSLDQAVTLPGPLVTDPWIWEAGAQL